MLLSLDNDETGSTVVGWGRRWEEDERLARSIWRLVWRCICLRERVSRGHGGGDAVDGRWGSFFIIAWQHITPQEKTRNRYEGWVNSGIQNTTSTKSIPGIWDDSFVWIVKSIIQEVGVSIWEVGYRRSAWCWRSHFFFEVEGFEWKNVLWGWWDGLCWLPTRWQWLWDYGLKDHTWLTGHSSSRRLKNFRLKLTLDLFYFRCCPVWWMGGDRWTRLVISWQFTPYIEIATLFVYHPEPSRSRL